MRWERGYRCHGLWTDDGTTRLGMVGISHRGTIDGYSWHIDTTGERGRETTLAKAKRRVENLVKSSKGTP